MMKLDRETERVEFKTSTGERKEAIRSIAAILNKHKYGELYFGVNNDGYIVGQIISDSTIKDISELIHQNIEPQITPTIEVIKFEDKEVLKITFSGTQRPYSAFGDFLIRVGTQNRKMNREELLRLFVSENYSTAWEKEITNFDITELDDNSLENFYSESISCGRLELPKYDKEKLLSILELTSGSKVNNAAIALFGKNANISLKLACFATDKKITFTDLKLFKGNIYNLVNIAMQYIIDHINWSVEIGKLQRNEIPEIPIRALREIVVNAFAHASYDPIPEIEINIHPNKITIFNPGSFPYDLTPNDFINKNLPSVKRNTLILDVLFRCKNVEKSGTGFLRMNELCQAANVKWDYLKLAYGFQFIFYRNNSKFRNNESSNAVNLKQIEESIYNDILNNPKISKSSLAEKYHKSEKTIQRNISSLIDKGLIIRKGNNQYSHFEVLSK